MPMRTLNRNKITLFLCKRDFTNTDLRVFEEPVEVEVNFSAANSFEDMQTFGENFVSIYRSNVGKEMVDLFNKTDRIYVGEAPNPFSQLCNDAPFEVFAVIPQINGAEIIYQKRSDVNGSQY